MGTIPPAAQGYQTMEARWGAKGGGGKRRPMQGHQMKFFMFSLSSDPDVFFFFNPSSVRITNTLYDLILSSF